jgi:putative ABC transport system permease protein
MERGRFLSDADDARCRSYAVLGSEAAKNLFPSGDPCGQSINLGSNSFTVIGVAQPRASGGLRPDSESDIYVPLNTSKARFGEWIRNTRAERSLVFQLSRIVVVLPKDARAEETVPLIRSILDPFHHRGAVEVVVVNPDAETK